VPQPLLVPFRTAAEGSVAKRLEFAEIFSGHFIEIHSERISEIISETTGELVEVMKLSSFCGQCGNLSFIT